MLHVHMLYGGHQFVSAYPFSMGGPIGNRVHKLDIVIAMFYTLSYTRPLNTGHQAEKGYRLCVVDLLRKGPKSLFNFVFTL